MCRKNVLVGIISDTHDLMRPEAMEALADAGHIIHCGDVCNASLLQSLQELAPVHAVRGNCDQGPWAEALPTSDTFEIGGLRIHIVHNLRHLDLDPEAAGISLVLSGHTHRPSRELRGGVIYFNPGSAGPRRFQLPVTLAHLRIEEGKPELEHIHLLEPSR